MTADYYNSVTSMHVSLDGIAIKIINPILLISSEAALTLLCQDLSSKVSGRDMPRL